jgi:hypothetical protein
MKPSKQRIAIAEYLGLKVAQSIGDNADCWFTEEMERDRRQRWRNACVVRIIPDYLNDLNAMHEAEKRLSDSQLSAYVGELANVIVNGEDKTILGNQMWHATAKQRSEAFLKTIEKWE